MAKKEGITAKEAVLELEKMERVFRAFEKAKEVANGLAAIEQLTAEESNKLAGVKADVEKAEKALAEATDTAKQITEAAAADAAAITKKAAEQVAKAKEKAKEIEASGIAKEALAVERMNKLNDQAVELDAVIQERKKDLENIEAKFADAKAKIAAIANI